MKTTIIYYKNWSEDESEIKDAYDVWKNHEGRLVYVNDDLTEMASCYHPETNYKEAVIKKVFKKSVHVHITNKTQEEIEKELEQKFFPIRIENRVVSY